MASEQTLDPQDWDQFALLAHRAVDDMLARHRSLREQPVWQDVPAPIRRDLDERVPMEGIGDEAAYEQFLCHVSPYPTGNLHPRFWGWVQSNGFPLANLADYLASGLNPHMAGFNDAPALVEKQVIDWMRQLMEFPEGASGLLLSGGSMANFTALVVARNEIAGYDVRADGVHSDIPFYVSAETHSWAKKSVEVLGLGSKSLRIVPANPDTTMSVGALGEMMRSEGRPGIVLATAGTVNIGATDDLEALADLCDEHGVWFHIDGAFGALAMISPRLRHIVKGLDRADSVAFDLHKWMYLPFEIACVLVRDGAAHQRAFSQRASYIEGLERGLIGDGLEFAELGLELTRGFKALKAWMAFKAYGISKFAALIEQNVEQAQYLMGVVEQQAELELAAPVPLNIVCFRYRGSNELNQELLLQLQERGIAAPSSTVLDGKFCIRVCFVNHRTQRQDIDLLIEKALEIGAELAANRL